MSDYLEELKNHREAILTGEIGALLHDVGKCHPDFVKSKSIEMTTKDRHAYIGEFLKSKLLKFIKDKKFTIKINEKKSNIYSLITEHHNHNTGDDIVKSLKICDRLDSADDKGVVRRKQFLENTIIVSPFGYSREKIDLKCLEKRFEDLQGSLTGLLTKYTTETIDLSYFRLALVNNLRVVFSHALGETRVPANDVTLWDHSYSTASLFKSTLAAIVLGEDPGEQWRIFGVCWNGVEFVNRGKKIAEIQKRDEIIKDIKRGLKKKFEDEIPVGSVIYEDTNSIYFTFPGLDKSKTEELAKECAQETLKLIHEVSNSELWPFFTLSKASRSLTIIADELKLASKKREIPKMLPVILVNNNSKEEKREQINLEWNLDLQRLLEDEIHKLRDNEKDVKIDICPVCQFRPKREKEERCNICEERRRGRLSEWFSNREETIWTDEVADENNRVALISLNFNLDRWLDGTMIGTIYSQSFEDWMDGEKENLNKAITGLKEELKKESKRINGMKKASDQSGIEGKVESKLKEQEELKERIKVLEFSLKQDKETIYRILDIFFDSKETNKKAAARILNTFFEENIGLNENTLDSHLDNISERIGILKEGLTKETLATYFFTQNPSPARLYRIWQETQEFFNLVIMEAKDKIYSNKWERIKFSVNDSTLISMLKPETPYIVQIDDLEPKGLLVFHNENGELYTIESLEKFKFKNEKGERKTGEEAVKEGLLKRGFKYLAPEDRPSKN